MDTNRLAGFFTERRQARFSFEVAKPTLSQPAFVACPRALIPAMNPMLVAWQYSIYHLAYEQARAAVESGRRARGAAHLWN